MEKVASEKCHYQAEAGTTLDCEERRRGSQARAADKHDEWSASCHGDNATTTDNSVTHSL